MSGPHFFPPPRTRTNPSHLSLPETDGPLSPGMHPSEHLPLILGLFPVLPLAGSVLGGQQLLVTVVVEAPHQRARQVAPEVALDG